MYAQKRIFPDHRAKNVPETSSENFVALVEFQNRTFCAPPGRKHHSNPRRTISLPKFFLIPLKGNGAFIWTFPLHLCLLMIYFQPWNAKLWSWKPPHGVIHRWCDSFNSVFYTLINHAFSTNQSARYIWTLLSKR